MGIPDFMDLHDEKHDSKNGWAGDEALSDALERMVPKAKAMMEGQVHLKTLMSL